MTLTVNTELLAAKFKKAEGKIELIRKPDIGHHPHCLKDPKPIIDFILESLDYTE